MNKNRGIWITLVCIVVIGAGVTFATSRYIGRNGMDMAAAGSPQTSYDSQTTSVYQEQEKLAAARGAMTGAAPDQGGENRGLKGADPTEAERKEEAVMAAPAAGNADPAKQNDEAAAPEALADGAPAMMRSAPMQDTAEGGAGAGGAPGSAAPSSEVLTASGGSETQAPVISPLGPAGDSYPEEDAADYYADHLNEIDTQIQKMRTEASDSTTYSMKNLAEKELQMWNLEMNSIYGIIVKALDTEKAGELEKSQQAWLKSRDTKAEETARKYSGGSLEGVEYTASLAESTRQRAYDLVAEYGDVMKNSNSQ